MNNFLQHVLMAYRPMYLSGLLLDGQYKLPKADPPDDPVRSPRPRQRMLLVALILNAYRHRSRS